MPELAEVEYYRRRFDPGLGREVLRVEVHPRARVFRGLDARVLARELTGSRLLGSRVKGKQMLFAFSGGRWLGIHLGMTGKLRVDRDGRVGESIPAPSQRRIRASRAAGTTGRSARRHDHLVLHQEGQRLVFSDPRLFGRIRFAKRETEPAWWSELPPDVLSPEFTVALRTSTG